MPPTAIFRRSADAKALFLFVTALGAKLPRRMGSDAERSCKAGTISGAGRSSPGQAARPLRRPVPGSTSAWVPWLARKITLHAPGPNTCMTCVNSTASTGRNTTSLLLVLDQLNLLQHHDVDVPEAGVSFSMGGRRVRRLFSSKDQWQQMVNRFWTVGYGQDLESCPGALEEPRLGSA